jgi:hypothetical protein
MTTDRDTLLALADDLQSAGGGSSWLDAEIAEVIDPDAGEQWRDYRRWLVAEDGEWTRVKPVDPPLYSSSLDAAMTLVPDSHTIQLSDWDHQVLRDKGAWQAIVLPLGARGSMQDFTFTNRCDHAATPALALTAACLRARAASLPVDGEVGG